MAFGNLDLGVFPVFPDKGGSLGLDYANDVIFAEHLLSFGQFKFGVCAKHKVPM